MLNSLKIIQSFEIETMQAYEGFKPGQLEWAKEDVEGIEKTYRLWPHHNSWRRSLCRCLKEIRR